MSLFERRWARRGGKPSRGPGVRATGGRSSTIMGSMSKGRGGGGGVKWGKESKARG